MRGRERYNTMQRQERSRSVRSTRSPSSSPVCLSPPSSSPSSSSSWSSGSSGPSSSSSWSSWAMSGSSITSSVLLWPLPLPTDSTATYDSSCTRLPSTLESLRFSTSSMSCPNLISVFTWSVMLLLISSCIGFSDAGILNGHPLGKRSFIDIQCKGIYDKSIFARLDRICEDCYNLFREPQLHQLCRKNCFTSDYFKGCLDVLLLQDEVEKIQTWIKHLHGAEPGV